MANQNKKTDPNRISSPEALDFSNLKEGEDFYFNEEGLLVFTETFHLKKGYCCQNGCKHCPYGFTKD